ncbi:hypothetical protein MTsPCn9_34710 [Croceitalea sp. MTPC9]|uniref:hypothetical protein n=1 Tax=unclassified Croceitalea TaxID=2632280 RepID=UPI002B3BB430|nr:hypothetical protein MTsPCn6_35440 [Croceitalea sp. MTPC6]GMN18531.1 hypothetical protein MTsPCn9_34710 [Croceitalea sp. MTPC9]
MAIKGILGRIYSLMGVKERTELHNLLLRKDNRIALVVLLVGLLGSVVMAIVGTQNKVSGILKLMFGLLWVVPAYIVLREVYRNSKKE